MHGRGVAGGRHLGEPQLFLRGGAVVGWTRLARAEVAAEWTRSARAEVAIGWMHSARAHGEGVAGRPPSWASYCGKCVQCVLAGEKKITFFGRNVLIHAIFMGLPFNQPPSTLTHVSNVKGKVDPI